MLNTGTNQKCLLNPSRLGGPHMGKGGYIIFTASGVPSTRYGGKIGTCYYPCNLEAHKWVKWLHNLCCLKGSHRSVRGQNHKLLPNPCHLGGPGLAKWLRNPCYHGVPMLSIVSMGTKSELATTPAISGPTYGSNGCITPAASGVQCADKITSGNTAYAGIVSHGNVPSDNAPHGGSAPYSNVPCGNGNTFTVNNNEMLGVDIDWTIHTPRRVANC